MACSPMRTSVASMDELLTDDGRPRAHAAALMQVLDSLGIDRLRERQQAVELDIKATGITFTIYSDGLNIDRAWPFDIISEDRDSQPKGDEGKNG